MDIDLGLGLAVFTAGASIVSAFAISKWKSDKALNDLEALRKEFTHFQIESAGKYVTATALKEMEQEVKSSLDRLTNRLDQVLRPVTRGSR